MSPEQNIGTAEVQETRAIRLGDWQQWAPYAAVIWSLIYAALGIFWLAGGHGFPFTTESSSSGMGPLIGHAGPVAAWSFVMISGIPAAGLGMLMLRGMVGKVIRPAFIIAGAILSAALLLLMTDLNLLVLTGYIPLTLVTLISGGDNSRYLAEVAQAQIPHQILCLIGGFAWLGSTIVYARRTAGACLVCGRRDGPEGWTDPIQASRWGRIAVYISMVAPLFYTIVRYAWALGIPLGMTEKAFRQGQVNHIWISGLFLASFGIVGAVLMVGLVQRWGEVFPRWMIGLAGRRVPIGLAVVPAALVSVILMVGGLVIWIDLAQMAAALGSTGVTGGELTWELFIQAGPTLLFPVWGIALAVATLGYYFRRRGQCKICGRGVPSESR